MQSARLYIDTLHTIYYFNALRIVKGAVILKELINDEQERFCR